MARGTNVVGGGAAGAAGAGIGFAGSTTRKFSAVVRWVIVVDGVGLALDILAPWPLGPNGPAMSSVTSICFCAARRESRPGLSRLRISLRGRATFLGSCSPPELTKTPGAAWRSSPNVIFTEPKAN